MAISSTDPDLRPRTTGELIKGNFFILLSTIFFGVNIPVAKILIPDWMSSVDLTLSAFSAAAY